MTSFWGRLQCRPPILRRFSFGRHLTGKQRVFLFHAHSLLLRASHVVCSSRYGFFNVRPTVIAFESTSRKTFEERERDVHRRLSVTGERRRLAVTFPVKFSIQGRSHWSASFLRDGYCLVTACLQLWNRFARFFCCCRRQDPLLHSS